MFYLSIFQYVFYTFKYGDEYYILQKSAISPTKPILENHNLIKYITPLSF